MSRSQRGQATVELALCLPVVVILVAFVIEAGMIAVDQVRLWHATREAARIAAVDPETATIERAAATAGLRGIEVRVEPAEQNRRVGEPVTVSLLYSPPGRLPFVGRMLDDIELSARVVARIEQP